MATRSWPENSPFILGDLVLLNSGSPVLTVVDLVDPQLTTVAWVDGACKVTKEATFLNAMLQHTVSP